MHLIMRFLFCSYLGLSISILGLSQTSSNTFNSKFAHTPKLFLAIKEQNGRNYLQIPDSLLYRDFLIISRVTKSAANHSANPLYAGDIIGKRIIQFTPGPNNKIFIRAISSIDKSTDSTENGMHKSVIRSNQLPIIETIDRSTAVSILSCSMLDITDMLTGDSELLFFDQNTRSHLQPGTFQADNSYVVGTESNESNVQIKAIKTYKKGLQSNTFELVCTIILLDKCSMKPRYADKRVGYFTRTWVDFDSDPYEARQINAITRWRIEPKKNDIERYMEGELVEPKKPIIFYIDPTTPKKWIPYIIRGVVAWQRAFEKAGFRNAINAIVSSNDDWEYPWGSEGNCRNTITWNPSLTANAIGSTIVDPRTGEILTANVTWYHNEMKWNRDNYFILASPTDPRARSLVFSDSLMGAIIESVITHEVGHTLGLDHNFSSSSTVSISQLRNKKWVEENGFCPSIMDYCRYNYVAQPEDGISEKGLMRRLGVYDEWAIEWGYRWFPDLGSYGSEAKFMNNWIDNRLKKDKRLFFGSEGLDNLIEDISDNTVEATHLGIKNLQRVASLLNEWSNEPNQDLEMIAELYDKMLGQFNLYLKHSAYNIGGKIYTTTANYHASYVRKKQQEAAMGLLNEQIFRTPYWLLDKGFFSKTGKGGPIQLLNIQEEILAQIMSPTVLSNLSEYEYLAPDIAFKVEDLLKMLKEGIWGEVKKRIPVDVLRRNLQKSYVARIMSLRVLQLDISKPENLQLGRTDLYQIIESHIKGLIADIDSALPFYQDTFTVEHLLQVKHLLLNSLIR